MYYTSNDGKENLNFLFSYTKNLEKLFKYPFPTFVF